MTEHESYLFEKCGCTHYMNQLNPVSVTMKSKKLINLVVFLGHIPTVFDTFNMTIK